MNKENIFQPIKKAGHIVCLFLFVKLVPLSGSGQDWAFDANTQAAYEKVLNLEIEEALALLPEPETAQETYVVSLAQTIELLITEDGEKYSDYYNEYEERLERRSKSSLQEDLLLQAELRLQWAFVYLKFGHELDAAWNLRQAYLSVSDCKKKFPQFNAINKASGTLEIILGSIPSKYNWVLGILGMEGSMAKGLEELEIASQPDYTMRMEAELLLAVIHGFVLQETDKAMEQISKIEQNHPENGLVCFLGAALAIKGSQSENALRMLTNLEQNRTSLSFPYEHYLKGEVYLHKADYLNSITAYRWFINHYKGQNYIKDAHYKIGLCYWLNGNTNDALASFKEAKRVGKEDSEADKYAARSLASDDLPNKSLTKARYFTDGGYYQQAEAVLQEIRSEELKTKRDQLEFHYRKARLAHKSGNINVAIKHYQETISATGNEPWYFAPNACLQMGYIMTEQNNIPAAREYFQRARRYDRHEYKNSIDTKAKTALAQINSRK